MFNSIVDDFRYAWSRPNSSLQRFIIVNAIIFIFINICRLILDTSVYLSFIRLFAMPSSILGADLGFPGSEIGLLHRPWTIITSFFTHEDFGHIFWNMIFLYWFGRIIRDYLGDQKLVALYFLGGIAGTISILVLYNLVPSFNQDAGGIALGASAAVFAISVAAATLMPDFSFHLLFLGPVKIKYIVAVQVFLAVIGLKGHNVGGEVAHLAGTVVGFFYIKELRRGNDFGAWINSTWLFIKSFFVRQPKIKVTHRSGSKKSSSSKSSKSSASKSSKSEQEEIDAILDKISQSGYESLSKEEKQKLFNASKK